MPSLTQIVNATITRGTRTPSRQGFGTPLFLVEDFGSGVGELKTYLSAADVVADGYDSNHAIYKMVSAAFAQSPSVQRVRVKTFEPVASCSYDVNIAGITTGKSITVKVRYDGDEISVTQAYATSVTATAAALASAIATASSGLSITLSCTSSASTVTITTTSPTNPFYVEASGTSPFKVLESTGDQGYDDQLAAIFATDQDFYAVCTHSNSGANALAVAGWCLSNKRLAIFSPQGDPSGDLTMPNTLRLATNSRAFGVHTLEPRDDFKDARLASRFLAKDPGVMTAEYKDLAGGMPDAFTGAQETALLAENCAYYSVVAGLAGVINSRTYGGDWLDITRDSDWILARLKEAVFAVLASADKVPYTDAGAEMIANAVRGILKEAERRNILAPGETTVTVAKVADQLAADREARFYPGISWQSRFAGAMHTVAFNGTVAV